jgi:hypothetical protein
MKISSISYRVRSAHADLIEMSKQVRRVLIDTAGAGAVELTPSIPTGEETDAECLSPLGGEEIPDAVADYEAGVLGTPRRSAAAGKRSGSGFA